MQARWVRLGLLLATLATAVGRDRPVRAERAEPGFPVGRRADLQLIEVPARVAGGTRISFSVDLRRPELDEAEVYLSLDGGRSYPVRLSEEVRARHRAAFDVELPNLAVRSARILVRAGGRTSEGHVELEVACSRTFQLVPDPRAPVRKPWADRGIRKRIGDRVHVEWWFTSSEEEPCELPADGLRGAGRLRDTGDASEGVVSAPRMPEPRSAGTRAALPSVRVDGAISGAHAPLVRIVLQLAAAPLPLRI